MINLLIGIAIGILYCLIVDGYFKPKKNKYEI